MPRKLYKYLGPGCLDKVLAAPDHVTLRCSYPKDFTDPYELFLTVDEQPDVLAFYQEVIGKMPQFPVTCFSRSPVIIPMWAHYAQNLEGVVIEIDEDILAEEVPKSGFGDIEYRDEPDPIVKDTLLMAHRIGKFRYFYFLMKRVVSAAYYTKASYWSHELERRLITRDSEVRREGDLMLLDVPGRSVTALVSGARASEGTKRAVSRYAEEVGCRCLEMRIGRTSATPYFVDGAGKPHSCGDQGITLCERHCEECNEPMASDGELCSWCRIEESDREAAASCNSFRVLAAFDLLKPYIEIMEGSSRRTEK